MRTHYPICDKCGAEINPNKYEDCDRYYIDQSGPLCRDCFMKVAVELMRLNLVGFAAMVGVPVVRV